MSKRRILPHTQALPYKSLPSRSRPSPKTTTPLPRRGKSIYIASGLFLGAFSIYIVGLYTTLSYAPSADDPLPDADVSSRYDKTAAHFDADVSFFERISGINALRRRLVSQASGDVLEVSVGTGRNAGFYNMGRVRRVWFVDKSGPMVEIARSKWRALHPNSSRGEFYTQSAIDPLPNAPKEGFTTIIQTMGICSTPDPSETLAHLGRLAHPTEGRVLLLEHGRSHYEWVNWILDKSAAKHADRHGCWFNRDVGKVVEGSGLRVEKCERSQFGTVWYIEARPPVLNREMAVEKEAEERIHSEPEVVPTEPKKGWLDWMKG